MTRKQRQHCQDITFELLDRTLRNYDDRSDSVDGHVGTPRHHANLDRSHWKQLKTQANASLYAERASRSWHDLNLSVGNADKQCVLLAVGTIDGSLDEVMFGLETPDFATVKVRSETLANRPLDGAILAQLASPTGADPFQSMDITWMVGQKSWPLNLVKHPRDFVLVSATGVMTHTNGEFIGYEVVQSIDLPQCPALPKPMVRGRRKYAAIYKQKEDGMVDAFIQMYVETQCLVFDKLAVTGLWESVLGFWNTPRLSEAKKLQWCMDNKFVSLEQQQSAGDGESKHCENCPTKRNPSSRRRSAHLSDHSTCALCTAQICSSCRVKRTLKVPGEEGVKLLDLHVAVCLPCLTFVQEQDPAEIAWDNQMQREACNQSKTTKRRFSFSRECGLPTFSPLGSNRRYPSISVSDLIKLMNSLSDLGMNRASQTIRRKTVPLH
ncbi:uncharacterized protein IUM83_10724 [Phytophthora cinnamomi]|uniref:uncharacterized protein n=1 Tax=Phytophthora cinnamomi TaxID=4785 RepID=UPI00355A7B8B|nr:hypothetical protein IUM83_10724 [Phytophthora cinnamomi]